MEAQESDPDSLLNYTRRLIALRHSQPELQARSPFLPYFAEPGNRLLAYKRGTLLCAVNPGREALTLNLDGKYRLLFSQGDAALTDDTLTLRGFAVLAPL